MKTTFRSRKTKWTLVFAALVALVFQVSCTDDSKKGEKVLNSVLSANVKGLDPIYANDVYSNTVVGQIYEPLLHYHYLKRPLQLEPLLAKEMPQVSEDGLTHTFKLRDGIRFQDSEAFPDGKGREVTAQDFIYSWKRLADPRNRSDGFWIFDGRIKGLNEWRDKVSKDEADYDTPVEGLQAPDDKTIVIKLTKPYYQLHYVLSMNYTSPVPKEAVEKYGKEFINHPVGTGPFMLDNWIRNSRVVLVKNPNWAATKYPSEGEEGDKEEGLLKAAGKEMPFVDKVVFHEITQDQPRWLKFMKGELDFVAIPKDNFDSAVTNDSLSEDLQKKGIELVVTREPDVTYTAFNMVDPILGENENLRKAMSLAYDTGTIIEKFYNGRAIVAHSPIPPDVDAYDPKFKNPYKEHNLSKAKEFMKKAGYPEGKGLPQLEFATTNSSTARQMAEFFKQNMAKIGIDIKIVTSSWPQFTSKIRDKKAQIFGIAWSADYPDAENFLQLLYGKNVSPGPNGANYKNAEFDRLYKKAAKLPPGPERTEIYKKMRDIAVSDVPWIFGAHRLSYAVKHGWLENYKRHSIISDQYKYLDIDTEERKEIKAKL